MHATFEAFGDLLFGCIFNGVVTGKPSSVVPRVQHAMDVFFEGIIGDAGRNAAGPRGSKKAKGES